MGARLDSNPRNIYARMSIVTASAILVVVLAFASAADSAVNLEYVRLINGEFTTDYRLSRHCCLCLLLNFRLQSREQIPKNISGYLKDMFF